MVPPASPPSIPRSQMTERAWRFIRKCLRTHATEALQSFACDLPDVAWLGPSPASTKARRHHVGIAWADSAQDMPPCPYVGRLLWEKLSPDYMARLGQKECLSVTEEHTEESFAALELLIRSALRWGLTEKATNLVSHVWHLWAETSPFMSPLHTEERRAVYLMDAGRFMLRLFLEEGYGALFRPLPLSSEGLLKETDSPALPPILRSEAAWKQILWQEAQLPLHLVFLAQGKAWNVLAPLIAQRDPVKLAKAANYAARSFRNESLSHRPHTRMPSSLMWKRLRDMCPTWEEAFLQRVLAVWGTEEHATSLPAWEGYDTDLLTYMSPRHLKRLAKAQGPKAVRAVLWAVCLSDTLPAPTITAWWKWALRCVPFKALWCAHPDAVLSDASFKKESEDLSSSPESAQGFLVTHSLSVPFPRTLAHALAARLVTRDVCCSYPFQRNIYAPLHHAFLVCSIALAWCPPNLSKACHADTQDVLEIFLMRHGGLLFSTDALHWSRLTQDSHRTPSHLVSCTRLPFSPPFSKTTPPQSERFRILESDFQQLHVILQKWGEENGSAWWSNPSTLTLNDLKDLYTWFWPRTFTRPCDASQFLSTNGSIAHHLFISPPSSRLEAWRAALPWLERLHAYRELTTQLQEPAVASGLSPRPRV